MKSVWIVFNVLVLFGVAQNASRAWGKDNDSAVIQLMNSQGG